MKQAGKQRLATGLIAGGILLLAIFTLPGDLFFLMAMVPTVWAAWEYAEIGRKWAPTAPLRLIVPLMIAMAVVLFLLLRSETEIQAPIALVMIFSGAAVVLLASLLVLLSQTEMQDAAVGMALIGFGVPYFSIPVICVYWTQATDPWLALMLLAIVAFGDTLAYYVGSKIGRRKIAPIVSPNKSWEGSLAGFFAGQIIALIWSLGRLGEVRWELFVLAGVTAVLAQCGDLIESMVKRGAGVKDSSRILPGHGGFYDRLDALLLASPAFVCGAWLLGMLP